MKDAEKVNLRLEKALIEAGRSRATESGYSLSEYVSRLINADLSRKNSIAPRFSRHAA